jgi:predicted ATPase/DNA-binding SARP family transcriptional activator
MRISLLGELEVRDDDGRDVAVAGAKQRALLVVLALHAGRPVPADQLVEALWGEDPPPAVRNGLQGLVSKLRRSLRTTTLVAMRGGGYALDLPVDAVDMHRFEAVVADGRAAAAVDDLAGAIALLSEAEAMWRGDALAEFTYEEFASTTIARLTELRLAAVEERIDAQLRSGRHHGTVGELEPLVAAHPLRERLRGLLMTAMYRAGRQADALRLYQEGRSVLAEELGLEPGPELRQLEAAILAQDPSLAGPAEPPSTGWSTRRSVIPEPLAPLFGRDAEVGEVTRMLRERRFITLVGPGGVGKTRLALEVARRASEHLAHGGCFVELAPVGDPVGVRTAITAALHLPDPNRIAEMIGERELVIVLDNCEHVIATAAAVAEDLLQRCPGLRLLATSREGLRIGGETVWPVPPLGPSDAVELFVARARSAGAQLDLSDDTVIVISEICARLDGLPLAIELAAARARAFPVHQISDRLNDRFRLLTGGSRTALPRQQTLRAVVDWSYELLFDDERRAFERLAVFPGGCDLATAREVCHGEDLPEADLEDTILALVEKSLVIAVPLGDELRFRQLQTLAQYGREKLAERGDATWVRDAMAAHFAHLCSRSAAAYIGDEQRAWLIAIDREQDNLRGALEWAVANDDAETALTIAGGASWPHWLRGTMVEGKRWLDAAFGCAGEASPEARGLGLVGRGLLEFQLGSQDHVDADLEEALSIFRASGDAPATALAHSFYAEFALARGDTEEARRRRLAALAHYETWPDSPFVTAACAYSRGKLGLLDRDLHAAEAAYREAADGFARVDRPMMRSMSLGVVADFDERARNYRAAITSLEEAVETNDLLGLHGFMGALQARLGWALLQEGDIGRAELMYERALDLARRLSNAPVVFLALTGQAVILRMKGRDDEAIAAGTEALDLYVQGAPRRLANRVDPHKDSLAAAAVCCAVLGSIAADAGQGERAALLLGHADGLRRAAGAPVPTFRREDRDRSLATIKALLGDEGFDAAFERGREGQLGRDVAFRL